MTDANQTPEATSVVVDPETPVEVAPETVEPEPELSEADSLKVEIADIRQQIETARVQKAQDERDASDRDRTDRLTVERDRLREELLAITGESPVVTPPTPGFSTVEDIEAANAAAEAAKALNAAAEAQEAAAESGQTLPPPPSEAPSNVDPALNPAPGESEPTTTSRFRSGR